MVRYVLMALVGLLVCGLSDAQPDCSEAGYFNLRGTAFEALNNSFLTVYWNKLKTDMETTESTLITLNPIVTKCQSDIKTAESDCIKCLNTTCQARVEALRCTDVVASTPSAGGCSLGKAICDIQTTASKAVAAIIVAGQAVAQIGKRVIGEIKKVANVVISTLDKAANEVANVGKQAVSGIVNTAEQVGKTLEKTVVNVGEKIVDGVKKAGEAIVNAGKEVGEFVEDTVNAIGKALGGRRRRQATEPTCTDFESNTTACNYYTSQCSACSSFNIGGVEPTASELVNGVCGASVKVSYENLQKLVLRVDQIIDAHENLTLVAASLNLNGMTLEPEDPQKNECVKVTFSMKIREIILSPTLPVNLFNPDVAAVQLVDDIYKEVLPVAE